jgi:aryl-alcohol dehydrogenase-like predicted oxidoreductase
VHPIVAVETEYSLWSRDAESDILPTCRELGIGYMAYAPLGRGFLSAAIKTLDTLLPKDRRHDHPRFTPDNFSHNVRLLAPIEKIAAGRKCTPAQVALAWVHEQGDDLEQNIAALDITLSDEELDELTRAFPIDITAGTRYPEPQMKTVGI